MQVEPVGIVGRLKELSNVPASRMTQHIQNTALTVHLQLPERLHDASLDLDANRTHSASPQ